MGTPWKRDSGGFVREAEGSDRSGDGTRGAHSLSGRHLRRGEEG